MKKCVVIYPEAHVWKYYTKIRPYPSTSFKFPVHCNVPAFCMTTTYYKRKLGKKPGIVVYIDGPFMLDNNLTKTIYIENFRGYKGKTYISIESLTAFVGKNDIGKSTILEALDVFFPDGRILQSDVTVAKKLSS